MSITIGSHVVPISACVEVNFPAEARVIFIDIVAKGYTEFIRFVVEQDKSKPDVMRKFVLVKIGGIIEDNYVYVGSVSTRHGVFLDMIYEVVKAETAPLYEAVVADVVDKVAKEMPEMEVSETPKRGRPARLEETIKAVKKNGV